MLKAENKNGFLSKLRKLWKVLFGRTTILIVLLAVQCFILFGGISVIGKQILGFTYIVGFIAVVVLLYILNARENSSFKIMWIIIILAVPVLGVPFYIFTRVQPRVKKISEKLDEAVEASSDLLMYKPGVAIDSYEELKPDIGLFKYMYDEGRYLVYNDASVKYFPLGEDKFRELVKQLKEAKEFIFLEYFIIDSGHMWNTVLRILARKAREGVEVRLMYDGTCTLSRLPRNYPKRMEKLGIKCRIFSPMRPVLSTHQNNRDHRKIVVIDGHTAFTGGVNLADEYINEKVKFGHWKDTAVMVKGKAVDNFTLMFLQMWSIYDKEPEDFSKYMYKGEHDPDPSMRDGGYVVPYGAQPFDGEEMGEKVYLDILNKAEDYVHIMTPYLILDDEIADALIFAAQRGVDVKIIMPHIPDKKYAYWIARTYYKELLSEGVEIYEYTPGFVHAKVFVSDDQKAVVGTINLDYRSLYLHFECGTYIWKNPVVNDIEEDYQHTLKKCQKMTVEDCDEYNPMCKVVGRALRVVAPLM